MNGGTRSRAISSPLTSPGIADAAAATTSPTSRPGTGPSAPLARLTVCESTTAANPMVKPTERSMPPEMMTKVWPIASSNGAVANTAIERMLKTLPTKLAPNATCDQISKPMTSSDQEQPRTRRGDGREPAGGAARTRERGGGHSGFTRAGAAPSPRPSPASGRGRRARNQPLSRLREREGPIAQRWEGEGPRHAHSE